MTRFLKRLTTLMLSFVLVGSLFTIDTVAAGGLSISSSASKVSEGDTFTVTVKAANDYFVAGISLSVSGGTVVSGLGKSSLDSGETTTAKIKLTGDSCKVSVTGTAANYTTETEGTASASVTVKKKAPATTEKKEETTTSKKEETTTSKKEETSTTKKEETTTEQEKSSNNKLSSITVSEGTLSPAFDSNTTSYKVSLPGTAAKVTLSAKASDSKASVSGTGEKELKAGDNEFSIVCKAENGSKKTYTVNVYVDESPLVYTTYQGQELGVVRNLENLGIPESFEGTKVILEEQEVPAFHSNQYNLTLVYLMNKSGVKDFYIFDSEQGVVSAFRPTAILGRNVVLYDLTEEEKVRENMLYQELTIDGVNVNGWVYETAGYEDYAYIPVMNEFGEKVIYEYEKTENSLQLYKEYVAPEPDVVEEEVTTVDILYFYIAAGAAAVLLVTTVGLFIYSRVLKKKNKAMNAMKDIS